MFCTLKKPAVGVPTGPHLFLWAGGGGPGGLFWGLLGYFFYIIFGAILSPIIYKLYI